MSKRLHIGKMTVKYSENNATLLEEATLSSHVLRDFMISWCTLNVEDKDLRVVTGCYHPLPWKLTDGYYGRQN